MSLIFYLQAWIKEYSLNIVLKWVNRKENVFEDGMSYKASVTKQDLIEQAQNIAYGSAITTKGNWIRQCKIYNNIVDTFVGIKGLM